METERKTKYYLVNRKFRLISGCDYGSRQKAEAAIPRSSIPNKDVVVFELCPWVDNKIDYSKCNPLSFD